MFVLKSASRFSGCILAGAFLNNNAVENWTPQAVNRHNAWIDTSIILSANGFMLMIVWIVLLPLIYIRRIFKEKNIRLLYSSIFVYGFMSLSPVHWKVCPLKAADCYGFL